MSKIAIGIITYGKNTAKYLPDFLASLQKQNFTDFKLFIYDNTDDGSRENIEIIRAGRLEFQIEIYSHSTNLGFGKAYNILIDNAKAQGFEYFMLLNIDMIFEESMLKNLHHFLDNNTQAGAATPKILRWDFENKTKTNIIDSYGLTIDNHFRFFDNYQGEVDVGQISTSKNIFGFTGAAALIRIKALDDISFEHEYFDETMFMYKEDCDLSMRLSIADWKTYLIPEAMAYHDRTAIATGLSIRKILFNRKNKNQRIKQWSFLNQLILLYKFSRLLPLQSKIRAWCYEIISIAYAALFERYLLKELVNFLKIRKLIKRKSLAIKPKIAFNEIAK